LLAFLTAGLKGVGRVDGQVSWEILAEKLEWRKKRSAV
jgi:gamma-tubulin complex component 5